MYVAATNYLTLLAMESNLIQLKKWSKKSHKNEYDKTSRFWCMLRQLNDDTAQKLLLVQTCDTRYMIPRIYLSEQYNINFLPR